MNTEPNCYIPDINLSEAIENLKRRRNDIIRYDEIMKMRDNPYDRDFQKKYDAFYRVRRNAEWREVYFDVMARYRKIDNLTFKVILDELYHHTKQIEASFTSKLLATINPDNPIWDSKILSILRLELDKDASKSKLENTVVLYEKIKEWYKNFLLTDSAKGWLEAFNQAFPEFEGFTPTKKIDFILWANEA